MTDKLCANHRAFLCRECGTKHYPECRCYFCRDDAKKHDEVDTNTLVKGLRTHPSSRFERLAADLIASQDNRIGELEGVYEAVNQMLAVLGADGEIHNLHPKVDALMNVLHDVDGGIYKPPKYKDENDTLKAMLRDVLPILERFAPIPHMKAKAMLSE